MRKKTENQKTFKVNISRNEFLELLAKGINPLSGDVLFKPSKELNRAILTIGNFVYRYERIGNEMFRVSLDENDLKGQKEKILAQKHAKQQVDKRTGVLWTKEEDDRLVDEYYKNVGIEEMMKLHDRTRSAIERRILKLIPIDKIKK